MERFATVRVPGFQFKFNLVVCPLPEGIEDVSLIMSIYKHLKFCLLRAKVDSM